MATSHDLTIPLDDFGALLRAVPCLDRPKTFADLQEEVDRSEVVYQAALEAVYGDRACQARTRLAGMGEPGTALRAAWNAYRDAQDALSAYEADLDATDEWRGCRPKRRTVIDQTGGRFRCP